MSKKVTILIPVYNGERYIAESIKSILDQTYKDFELLIINDGSTDKTNDIIKSFKDIRIRLIENPKNLGLILTRNKGLKESTGEYIAFLDSDDIAYPSRIEKQITFLEKNQDFGMVGSWVKIIDEKSKETDIKWKYFLSPNKIPFELLFNNYFTQSSVIIRKKILQNETYREGFAPAEDYDLWVRIAEKTKVWNLPKYLTKYRIHDKNISKTSSNLQKQCAEKVIMLQLQNLNINPSEEELYIHQLDFNSLNISKKEFINKEEIWLKKLINANTDKKIYSIVEFSKFISKRWMRICASNIDIRFWVLRKYFNSELSKDSSINLIMIILSIKYTLKNILRINKQLYE